MHVWGEEGVDWRGINDAAQYIRDYLVRWGRISVRDWKEKYGTVRIYCSFGWESLHSITHPGYVYSQYPKWLWSFCCSPINSWIFTQINRVVVPYHVWLYRRAYRNAIEKWPHLEHEICSAADYGELLYGIYTPYYNDEQNG
jgi:hypothetical protein